MNKLVFESLEDFLKCQENINEGKFGRALGAAALGAALSFGSPQMGQAQDPIGTEQTNQKSNQGKINLLKGIDDSNFLDITKTKHGTFISLSGKNKEKYTNLYPVIVLFNDTPDKFLHFLNEIESFLNSNIPLIDEQFTKTTEGNQMMFVEEMPEFDQNNNKMVIKPGVIVYTIDEDGGMIFSQKRIDLYKKLVKEWQSSNTPE